MASASHREADLSFSRTLGHVAPVQGEAPRVVDRGLARRHAAEEVARTVLEHGRGLPGRDPLAAAGSARPARGTSARPGQHHGQQAPGDRGPQALGLARRRDELGRRRLARRDRRLERVAAGQHRGDDERGGGAAPRLLLEAGEDRPLDRGVEAGHEGRGLDRPLVPVLADEARPASCPGTRGGRCTARTARGRGRRCRCGRSPRAPAAARATCSRGSPSARPPRGATRRGRPGRSR